MPERLGYTGSDIMHAILNMVTTEDSTRVVVQAFIKSKTGFGRNVYAEDITYGITGAEVMKILQRIKIQVESP